MAKNWTARLIGRALFLTTSTAAIMGVAYAQDEGAAQGNDDEIIVTAPLRDSLERSLLEQRNADNVANIIAADTIGRFPDNTAASALARLPGVGVQRDQGQERYIQIRGAPTRWTQVSFDGVNVLGAEDRIFRFDSVPAALISQLELNKTLLPSMPAEALAGRVNIVTFEPLSVEGFDAFLDVGYGVADLGDGPVEQIAGRVSWSNGVFGVSVTGSHFSFEQHTDNSEPRFDTTGISQLRITKYIITRQTESYSLRLQYQPDPDHLFTFTHLKTEFNDFEERNQARWQFSRAVSGTRDFTTVNQVGVPQENSFEDGIYSNGVYYTVLRGEHNFSNWQINWDVGYTTTEFVTDVPLVVQSTAGVLARTPTATEALQLPSMQVQVNAVPRGIPAVTLFTTVPNGTGGVQRGVRLYALPDIQPTTYFVSEFSSTLETEALTFRSDVTRDWDSFGAQATFSAGVQYDDRSQTASQLALVRPDGVVVSNNASGFNLGTQAAALGRPWTPLEFVSNRAWDTNFNYGYVGTYIRSEAMFDQVRALMDAARAANGAGANIPVFGIDPRTVNTVDETVLSGFVQNRWEWDRHTLLAGVRVEQTEIAAAGFIAQGLVPLVFESDEISVFPSLHYTYDFSDDVVLRAAFISGQARPSLTDLQASVSINDTTDVIVGGNPFATPETAYGFDVSAEWYFAPGSLLAVSAYHREVEGVLFDASQIVTDARFNSGGVVRTGYTFETTLNGGDGNVSGIEFTYYHPWTFLPGWLDGFGFQGSIAFTQGEFEAPNGAGGFTTVEFPGTSERLMSAVLFYENFGFSARLTYQYRTDWLDEVFPSGSAANQNLYWDETERVDFSARYQLSNNYGVYFDAVNVFDEFGVRYQGTENRPYEVESFGRRFLFGVRANF